MPLQAMFLDHTASHDAQTDAPELAPVDRPIYGCCDYRVESTVQGIRPRRLFGAGFKRSGQHACSNHGSMQHARKPARIHGSRHLGKAVARAVVQCRMSECQFDSAVAGMTARHLLGAGVQCLVSERLVVSGGFKTSRPNGWPNLRMKASVHNASSRLPVKAWSRSG